MEAEENKNSRRKTDSDLALVMISFSEQDFYFVFRGVFHWYSRAMNIRLFQLTGSSLDNRFIVSLNDKPVKGHKLSVHKYSTHENSSEIDHGKQNKSHVQKKSTATETRPSFSPLI